MRYFVSHSTESYMDCEASFTVHLLGRLFFVFFPKLIVLVIENP